MPLVRPVAPHSLRFLTVPAAVLALMALAGCAGAPEAVNVAPGSLGYTCYAGRYICRMPAQYPVGTSCTCPGLGAPSYGTIR